MYVKCLAHIFKCKFNGFWYTGAFLMLRDIVVIIIVIIDVTYSLVVSSLSYVYLNLHHP